MKGQPAMTMPDITVTPTQRPVAIDDHIDDLEAAWRIDPPVGDDGQMIPVTIATMLAHPAYAVYVVAPDGQAALFPHTLGTSWYLAGTVAVFAVAHDTRPERVAVLGRMVAAWATDAVSLVTLTPDPTYRDREYAFGDGDIGRAKAVLITRWSESLINQP